MAEGSMPLQQLIPGSSPAPFDVQDSTFSHDILGRYICNNWQEIDKQRADGGYPFDAVIIGAGMFGAYCAEKLYRHGTRQAARILLIDAGAFLVPSHVQNLPQRLGGKIGGPDNARTRDTGTQNVIWGMPWISNEAFSGLAYCVGGRSVFWGGWSPRLTDNDLSKWPGEIISYLNGTTGDDGAYKLTEREIGVDPSTDYIVKAALFTALDSAFKAALPGLPAFTGVKEAPLAVQGSSPAPGVFPFDKFSACPFLIDALRHDSTSNSRSGDVSRRLFLLPRTQVLQLNRAGNAVVSLDLVTDGQRQTLFVRPDCAVVLANGTIEATRLALDSFGIGDQRFGSPRVGNLMAHLRSNITVRIKRSVLGLASPPSEVETVAFLLRGEALGRRFHHQVTAAAVVGTDPEKVMWSMVPDIELLDNMLANQDPNWVTITFRGIGEMEDQPAIVPDPARSWVDLSNETDRWSKRRAYVNLVATQNDRDLWTAMDEAAFGMASAIAKDPANIQYLGPNGWQNQRPQPDPQGKKFWQDILGSTHHEAGTLFMGAQGSAHTDLVGRLHGVANAYVAGPAVFPSLGSANPSLTALALTRRTADAVLASQRPAPDAGFTPLSLDPKDWKMIAQPNSPASMIHHGSVLESSNGYGLYFYTKEPFANFILKLDWRVGRRDDNSGIFIRTPGAVDPDPLNNAVGKGHEIQIDERGYDSATNTEGHTQKQTGAIYDLQAPSALTSRGVGTWNTYLIAATGNTIRVTLNGQVVNVYDSNRQTSGFIALQAYKDTSRVQFRNIQVQKLP
jgi:choline dehydrogenase-like flavoprotein